MIYLERGGVNEVKGKDINILGERIICVRLFDVMIKLIIYSVDRDDFDVWFYVGCKNTEEKD